MAWATLIISGAQYIASSQEKKADKERADKVSGKRKAYSTPIELYKQQNALENAAQSGFAPEELSYLTNQSNQAFGDALSTAQSLGGDPNSFSTLFNNHVDNIMGIEGADHNLRMQKFNSFINSYSTLADSKTAEQVSQDNLLKDQLQSIQADRNGAAKSQESALNLGVSSLGTLASNNLYKQGLGGKIKTAMKLYNRYGFDGAVEGYQYMDDNNLNYDQYKTKMNSVGAEFKDMRF